MFGCVELDVVLGQDLHDGPNLQPPLCLGDAVPVAERDVTVTMYLNPNNIPRNRSRSSALSCEE